MWACMVLSPCQLVDEGIQTGYNNTSLRLEPLDDDARASTLQMTGVIQRLHKHVLDLERMRIFLSSHNRDPATMPDDIESIGNAHMGSSLNIRSRVSCYSRAPSHFN